MKNRSDGVRLIDKRAHLDHVKGAIYVLIKSSYSIYDFSSTQKALQTVP